MTTPDDSGAVPAFVALCSTCKNFIGAAVDIPQYAKTNAQTVARWIRAGRTIVKMTVADARIATMCRCPRPPRRKGKS